MPQFVMLSALSACGDAQAGAKHLTLSICHVIGVLQTEASQRIESERFFARLRGLGMTPPDRTHGRMTCERGWVSTVAQ